MRMRALSSAPAAVRMRLHRKRRREGTHYVSRSSQPLQQRPNVGRITRPSRGEGARRVARGWDEQIAFGFTLGNMRPDPGTGLNALEKQPLHCRHEQNETCC